MKNHYATLGITPQAEDIVIRAAYKALAQKYHPDKSLTPSSEAESRMRDINEAYETLSDKQKRKDYDEQYFEFSLGEAEESERSTEYKSELSIDQERNWTIALDYYPDLESIAASLHRTSKSLAYTYKLLMLDRKQYADRRKIAFDMHKIFLSSYFGDNPEIVDFAKYLIEIERRDAALALNEAVRVLGPSLDSALVIHKIKGRFGLLDQIQRPESQQNKTSAKPTWASDPAADLMRSHGLDVEVVGQTWFITNKLGDSRELKYPSDVRLYVESAEAGLLGGMREAGFHDSLYFVFLLKYGLNVSESNYGFCVKNKQGDTKHFSSLPSFRAFSNSHYEARKGKAICPNCGSINQPSATTCFNCPTKLNGTSR